MKKKNLFVSNNKDKLSLMTFQDKDFIFSECEATLTREDIKQCTRDPTTLIGCRLTQCDRITIDSWHVMIADNDIASLTRVFHLSFGMGHIFALIFIHCREMLWTNLNETSHKILYRLCTFDRNEKCDNEELVESGARKCRAETQRVYLSQCRAELESLTKGDQGAINRLEAKFEGVSQKRRVKIALDLFNNVNARADGIQLPWYGILADTVIKKNTKGGNALFEFFSKIVNVPSSKKYNLIEVLHDGVGERMAEFSDKMINGLTQAQLNRALVDSDWQGTKTCGTPGCKKKAVFGYTNPKPNPNNDDQVQYCAKHKKDDMVDIALEHNMYPDEEKDDGQEIMTLEDLRQKRKEHMGHPEYYNNEVTKLKKDSAYLKQEMIKKYTDLRGHPDPDPEYYNYNKDEITTMKEDYIDMKQKLIKEYTACGPKDIVPDVSYMNDTTEREDVFCPRGYQRRRYNGDFGGCCKKALKSWQKVRETFLTMTPSPEEYRQSCKRLQALQLKQYNEVENQIASLEEERQGRDKVEGAKESRVKNCDANGLSERSRPHVCPMYPTAEAYVEAMKTNECTDEENTKRWSNACAEYHTAAAIKQRIELMQLKEQKKHLERTYITEEKIEHQTNVMERETEILRAKSSAATEGSSGSVDEILEHMTTNAWKGAMRALKERLLLFVKHEKKEDSSWAEFALEKLSDFATAIIGTVMTACENQQVANTFILLVKEWREQVCVDISIKMGLEKKVSVLSREGVQKMQEDTMVTVNKGYEMMHAMTGPGLADSLQSGISLLLDATGASLTVTGPMGIAGATVLTSAGKFAMRCCHQRLKISLIKRMYTQGLANAMEIFTAPCIKEQKTWVL